MLRARVIFFVLVSLALFSSPAQAGQSTPIIPPWALAQAHVPRQARVYIDVSGSIRGFTGFNGALHPILLADLKSILVNAGIDTFEVSEVAGNLTPAQSVDDFVQYGPSRLYHGAETYLPTAVADASGTQVTGDLVLVLTDGVLSLHTRRSSPRPTESALGCAPGDDVACMALTILNYVAAGHGFWIVGIRMPFRGPYYIEGGGAELRRGAVLRSGRFPDRPFYVWVGSPSIAQGRQIVGELLAFAKQHGADHVAVEVAPGAWEDYQVSAQATASDLAPPSPKFCARGDLLENLTPGSIPAVQAAQQQHSFYAANPSQTLGFMLPVTEQYESPTSISPLVTYLQQLDVEPKSAHVSSRFIQCTTSSQSSVGQRCADVCLAFDQSALSRTGQTFHIVSGWQPRSPNGTPPWDNWATGADDTRAAVARTLNLDSFFRTLRRRLIDAEKGGNLRRPFLDVHYPNTK